MEGMPGNNKDDNNSEKKTPSPPKSKKKFSKEEMDRSVDNNNIVEGQRSRRQFLIGAEHRDEAFGPDFQTDKERAQQENESNRLKKKPELEEQEEELHQKAENERNYNTHGTWRDGQKKDRNDRDR